MEQDPRKLQSLYRILMGLGIVPNATFGLVSIAMGLRYSIYLTIPLYAISALLLSGAAYYIGQYIQLTKKTPWF